MPEHAFFSLLRPGGPPLRARAGRLLPVFIIVLAALAPGHTFRGLAADSTVTGSGTPVSTGSTLPSVTSTLTAPKATSTQSPTSTVVATATRTLVPTTPAAGTATATDTATAADTATVTATIPTGPIREQTPPRHYVVMIVVDAGRPSYYNARNLPHIHALMKHGVVYDQAWVGELNSSTPDVHVTFGTGTLPRENGFLGFGWADPVSRRTVDFRTLLANGAIDPILKSLPVPSIASRLHEFMPNAVSVASSGHKDYAAVGLGGGTADYVLYGRFGKKFFSPAFLHAPPPLTASERQSLRVPVPLPPGGEDTWAFKYASIVAKHVKPKLLMINLPEMDTWGHWYGPNANAMMARLMQNVDRGVGLLEKTYRDAGILNRTDFIITADHGMMQSIPARNWGAVQRAAAGPAVNVARGDGEGGAIWLNDPSQAQAAAERVVAMHPAHVEAVFYRSHPGNDYSYVRASPLSWLVSQATSRALNYLVNTVAGINGPDVWVLYRENYSVVPRNVAGQWKGTHGGSTWKVQHVPLIISGPGVRKGVHSRFAARAVDIAPTIERLLGLPAIHRDGVILADALINPTKYETGPQRAITAELNADVGGLQRQSASDTSRIHNWPKLPPAITKCVSANGTITCKVPPASPTDG